MGAGGGYWAPGEFSPPLPRGGGALGFAPLSPPSPTDAVTGWWPGPQPFPGIRLGLSGCGVHGWAVGLLRAEAKSGSGCLTLVWGRFCRGLTRWLVSRIAPGAPWRGPRSPRADCKPLVAVGLREPEPGACPRPVTGSSCRRWAAGGRRRAKPPWGGAPSLKMGSQY